MQSVLSRHHNQHLHVEQIDHLLQHIYAVLGWLSVFLSFESDQVFDVVVAGHVPPHYRPWRLSAGEQVAAPDSGPGEGRRCHWR